MKFFVIGKVNGATGSAILLVGVGLSILTAVFSEKGKLKTIILSLYGILIVGFVTISILFAVSHM